jgi:predicted TIM-barrel fold metal-dependent hydrolase
VGKFGYKHSAHLWSTEDILGEMERCGIAGALIYHGMAKSHSPVYGNGLLPDELCKSPRLFGCHVVLPPHLGDFPVPGKAVLEMHDKGIRAAKIFPYTHKFDLDERTVGHLFSALEEARIPLLVDGSEISLGQMGSILKLHPNLKVILTGQTWSQERRLFPLMDEFEGLHIELSTLQANAFIEVAYERYGAMRLLFGGGMPYKSVGAARAFIDYSCIPNEAKQLIAGGNLSRLLGISPPPIAMPVHDEIIIQASQGLPIDSVLVLDSHTHLIEDGGATGSGMPMLRADIDSMISSYRALGIRKMTIAPWVGINGGDAETGNLIAEETIHRYPEQVNAFVRIDPNYTKDIKAEAHKWHLEKRFKGMKPYYFSSHINYTHPVYEPWWRLGNDLQLFALVDPGLIADNDYVEQIDELAQRYPEVNLFMDHAGRSFEIAEQYAEVARRYPNVTLQLTYTTVTLGVIEYLVKEVGADKILFGTDSPMRDPRPQVGWLAYANLTMEEKKKIFGGNFERILERCLL